MDLVEFLTARLDEDEQAAMRVKSNWRQIGETGVIVASDDGYAEECANGNWTGIAEHIVRHDPARVLAEVDAKRQLLDDHRIERETYPRPTIGGREVGGPYFPFGCANCHAESDTGEVHGFGYCLTWKALALPYAGHPDYDEAWRP